MQRNEVLQKLKNLRHDLQKSAEFLTLTVRSLLELLHVRHLLAFILYILKETFEKVDKNEGRYDRNFVSRLDSRNSKAEKPDERLM